MSAVIICPSCGRRLKLNQDVPPNTPLACPGCQTVFSKAADEVPDTPQLPCATSASAVHADGVNIKVPVAASSGRTWPAEDDDRPVLQKPAGNVRRVLRPIVVAVLALLITFLAIVLLRSGGSQELVGSWRGKFQFANIAIDCLYTFRSDGTFVDEHVDPDQGVRKRFPGRYTFFNGQVAIAWDGGGFEKADVRRTGPNSFEYVVVAHSDRNQVGCKVTFARAAR